MRISKLCAMKMQPRKRKTKDGSHRNFSCFVIVERKIVFKEIFQGSDFVEGICC